MPSLERYFAMARGSDDVRPLAMTKWLDSNCHHLVPEISGDTPFALCAEKPLAHFREALEWGFSTRPVLLGPVSFLLLAKPARPESQPLDALENLLPVYEQLLCRLHAAGVQAVQIDEPCLDRISGRRGLRSIAPSSQLFAVPPSFQITLNAAVGTD
jgi:5-methyltetrahydropteroyltriglutamate--homocysteine methyltransferase